MHTLRRILVALGLAALLAQPTRADTAPTIPATLADVEAGQTWPYVVDPALLKAYGESLEIAAGAGDITAVTAGNGLTGGGTSGAVTLNVATPLYQIAQIADPNADRILFWDDSAGSYAVLTVTGGLTISGTNLTAAIDASGFDGNLETTDDTLQEVAQKLDDLVTSGTDDQTAAEVAVTPTGNLASTNAQDALEELQSDIDSLSAGTVADDSITAAKMADGDFGDFTIATNIATLDTDSVSANELNATGVEAELEAVLDLQDMQGAVTDAQVPNNITVDLATTATTANAGDSATSFFSTGTIEDARLPTTMDGKTLTNVTVSSGTATVTSVTAGSIEFEGATADDYETSIAVTDPTADRTITLPDATGTVALAATQSGVHATPTTTNPLSPTWAGQMYVVWYGATGTINLPAAAGYTDRGILIYNTGAFTVTIDSNGTEVIVRDGTVQSGGVSMTLSSGAGNYVALISDGARWVTLGYKGTLAQGS